jgi:hypothetical protein
MNEFRRSLVDRSGIDPGLSADAAFVVTHQASAGFLLAGLSRTYPELRERSRTEGPTPELDAEALDAAGTLATVLQSLRSRPDLLAALEHTEGGHPPPMTVLDQLFHSFVLLTAGATAEEREAALTAEELAELIQTRKVREWLAWLEVEGMFAPAEEPSDTE